MSRVAVAVEGCPMGDSRVIDHKALSLGGRTYKALSVLSTRVPVLNDAGEIVGMAYNFERDENGVIWLEVELLMLWEPYFDLEKTHYAHIAVGECLWDQADETAILRSGVIYNLTLTQQPTPWDVINHRAV